MWWSCLCSVSLRHGSYFVEYLVSAISLVLTCRKAIVVVLHDVQASKTLLKPAITQAPRTLDSADFVMKSLVLIDVMTPAAKLSKTGQADMYTTFQDERATHDYTQLMKRMSEGSFSGHVEAEGPELAAGSFRGASVGCQARYPSRKRERDAETKTDVLAAAKMLRKHMAVAILAK